MLIKHNNIINKHTSCFHKKGICTVVTMRIWSSTNNHTAYWLHAVHIHVTTNGYWHMQTLHTGTVILKNV